MKITLVLFSLLCSVQCKPKINFYHGHIYSKDNEPIKNLTIYERYDKSKFSRTDAKGYFKINVKVNHIKGVLMVESSKSKLLDSIQVIGTQGGERLMYSFVEGKNDTLFLELPSN